MVELDKHSKAFLLLQEIRNESHRFALEAQRKKKRKSMLICVAAAQIAPEKA